MWRVVDITTHVAADGSTRDCSLTPLVDPMSGGYNLTVNDSRF